MISNDNRIECEKVIGEKIKELRDIYLKYYHEGSYLSIHIEKDYYNVNNCYWDSDKDFPIDISEFEEDKE